MENLTLVSHLYLRTNGKCGNTVNLIWKKIRTCLSNVDWDEKFNNLHVDEMVFTSVFIEIATRYIPHKIIKIDDRDPPWITCEIKIAGKRKHKPGRKYVKQVRNTTCPMIKKRM